jgi:hypothetical protein
VENIHMDLKEMGGMDWIDLVQGMGQWRSLVNMALNLQVL